MLMEELQRQTAIVQGFHQQVMTILPVHSQEPSPLSLADKDTAEQASQSRLGSQ